MAEPKALVPEVLFENPKHRDKTDDWIYRGPIENWREYARPLRMGEKPNQKEERDESGSYSRGGAVRKFGSDTCIVCKDKFA